ncbi:fimbrial protein [Buttiauxella agrestis]|uniref:Fimbrial subunit n=1 Tax=Buttiauxella agrestis ATCC 33320 TaxID=1006004 RepID=A0A085GCG9_9ENTR|nr:fimbrial protein [Buttiauxella agrestis]KFC81414.1 fimbrial subunit [Buttiauxella agrestis ATCC 33320]
MKFNSALLSLVAAGLFSVAAHADTTVAGGTIKFEGQVVDAACSVFADSMDQTVTLDQVTASKLATAGTAAGQQKSFNIKLEDCDTTASQNASVTFIGQSDAVTSGALANTAGAGAATNVALQLYGADGAVLPLGTTSSTTTLIDGENILPFSVDYIATGAAATAGNVSAVATFSTTFS